MDERTARGRAVKRHTFLESFDGAATPGRNTPTALNTSDLERLKTDAYEAGYKCGWDDAIASDDKARDRIEAEFERNIQNLTFTYSEAVDTVRSELKEFIAALIEQFLPSIAPDLLREHIRDQLLSISEAQIEPPLEIVASTDSHGFIEEFLASQGDDRISLIEDRSLASRQVFVRLGDQESKIDFAPIIEDLRNQFAALAASEEKKDVQNA